MSPRPVQLTRAAARDLDSLPPAGRDQVTRDLRTLTAVATGPPPRIKRLKGFGFPLYRLRSGDYRILYRVDEAVLTVLRVIDRRDLDRTLRRLRLSRS